ncbi:MAG: hypothetical protein WAL75_25620 [Terracidiphilus sp.]
MRPGRGTVSSRIAEASSNSPNDYMSIAAQIEACDHPLAARELAEIIGAAKSTIYDAARAIPPRIPHVRWGTMVRFDPLATAEWYRQLYCGCEGLHGQTGSAGRKEAVRVGR